MYFFLKNVAQFKKNVLSLWYKQGDKKPTTMKTINNNSRMAYAIYNGEVIEVSHLRGKLYFSEMLGREVVISRTFNNKEDASRLLAQRELSKKALKDKEERELSQYLSERDIIIHDILAINNELTGLSFLTIEELKEIYNKLTQPTNNE